MPWNFNGSDIFSATVSEKYQAPLQLLLFLSKTVEKLFVKRIEGIRIKRFLLRLANQDLELCLKHDQVSQAYENNYLKIGVLAFK